MKKILPNSFIVGAAKCGTTSLSHWLSRHHDVCLSNPKETNFFNIHFMKGSQYLHECYENKYDNESVIMDASTNYGLVGYVPQRIADLCGSHSKIIYMVREPISRAYSQWWMFNNYHAGRIANDFDFVMFENLREFSPFKYELEEGYMSTTNGRNGNYKIDFIEQGLYATNVMRYIDVFGINNVKVITQDDLQDDPIGTYSECCEFLGVEFDISMVDQIGFERMKVAEKKKPIKGDLESIFENHKYVSKKLVQIYAPQISLLSEITGEDLLSKWGYRKLMDVYK